MSANAARLDRARAKTRKALESGFCEAGNCDYCRKSDCPCEHHKDSDAEVHAGTPVEHVHTASPVAPGEALSPHGTDEVPDEAKGTAAPTAAPASASDIKPGLHFNLPNEDYHSLTEWLSSSQLKALLPEHYQQGGNQAALDFGSLFHTVLLEPDELAARYVVLDPFEVGVKADGSRADNPLNTTAWKKACEQATADGLTVVSPADWDKAHAMRDAVLAHDEARGLLHTDGAQSEVSAFVVDPETGVKMKARFDLLAPMVVVDAKSTAAKPGAYSLTKAVMAYGYDLSAAHYLHVAELAGLEVDGFTLLFVGKEHPYRVTVADLDDLFIKRGRDLRDLAIKRLMFPDVEPAYEGATGRLILTPPLWALDDQMEMNIA